MLRTLKAVPVLCAVASLLILLKAVPAAAATAAPYFTSSLPNMPDSTFDPMASISFNTGGPDTRELMKSLWLLGLGVFLGWTALNVSGPKDMVKLLTVLSSPPQEAVKVIERIVPVNCTCNGQADDTRTQQDFGESDPVNGLPQRTFDECVRLHESKRSHELNDAETIELTLRGVIPSHSLEKSLADHSRAVRIRRAVVSRTPGTRQSASVETSQLPFKDYDFSRVFGSCAENVIGYMPVPVGVAGPLRVDGHSVFLPMATTEGALIASTSRGCKAINAGGGAITVMTGGGMTRAPVVRFRNVSRAGAAKDYIDSSEGQDMVRKAFESTSRFMRLQRVTATLAGSYMYLRFKASTGDAMGMNMISKGVQEALALLQRDCGFEDMVVVSISGNYCTDKKPAAINWVDGRGKGVVAEAVIPGDVVRQVLKCTVPALVRLNISKNLVGSAMAGSIGGYNAHAANIVTAMFLATGQDPAQNVGSSSCITLMEE